MVGFSAEKQRRLFAVLSAVLLLGNIEFSPRKSTYHHDEAVSVKNDEVVSLISELLRVKEETLLSALTAKRAKASGETLVINYKLPEVHNISINSMRFPGDFLSTYLTISL
jgi:myosin heavy subunit